MEKIIIYAVGNDILIIGNANTVDLLYEYYGLLTDTTYLLKDFSYGVYDAENRIRALTINNGKYHFCKRYSSYRIAKKRFKKISTCDFGLALNCIYELSKTATK